MVGPVAASSFKDGLAVEEAGKFTTIQRSSNYITKA
jgi:hypothetical protein